MPSRLVPRTLFMIALAGALALGGCCSLPLGGSCTVKDQVRLRAALSLNDCEGTGSHVVTLRLYSLSGTDAFAGADFGAVWLRAESTLGEELVEFSEHSLQPGEEIVLTLPRDKKTRALGVVANFCDATPGCWKQSIVLTEDAADTTVKIAGTCLGLE